MDADSLLLAGITGSEKDGEEVKKPPTTPSGRTIIKPAWLSLNRKTDEAGKSPPSSSDSGPRKVRKRKTSSTTTSTPKTSKTARSPTMQRSPASTSTSKTNRQSDPDIEMIDPEKTAEKTNDASDDLFRKLSTYMDRKLDKMSEDMTTIRSEVGSVTRIVAQVNTNSENISALKQDVNNMTRRMEETVSAAVAREMRNINTNHLAGPDRMNKNEENYWKCRRSVRCWPIRAPEDDLWGATGDFFVQTLGIPGDVLHQESVEYIRKLSAPRSTRTARIQNEVLVVFKDVHTRDLVFSYAPNLAKYRNSPNPPGIRLDYPDHLRGAFQTLEKYGVLMKSELGGEMKRSIKFDDQTESMRIDVCFPGDATWTRIPLDIAREEVRKRSQNEVQATRTRLDSLNSNESTTQRALSVASNAGSNGGQNTALSRSSTLEKFAGNKPPSRWTSNK